jgi:hypothetical protein
MQEINNVHKLLHNLYSIRAQKEKFGWQISHVSAFEKYFFLTILLQVFSTTMISSSGSSHASSGF